MASTGRTQPPWQLPKPADDTIPPIRVYNSLTRSKTLFLPLKSEKVTWYACGPTVYDDAHLGHARTYVSTDIIRRILRDFFKLKDLQFVENVTDVDDKIILRGRQQHFLEHFKSETSSVESAVPSVKEAFQAYAKKNAQDLPADLEPGSYEIEAKKAYGHVQEGKSLANDGSPPGDKEAKLKMHLSTLAAASEAIQGSDKGGMSLEAFYKKTDDVLLPYLDSLHGSEIDSDDHSIFTKLTKEYEERFYRDMRELNVQDPDVITRVTEYIPQIVKYVEKIIDNGFGYTTSDGSVYFDITAFERAGFHYARLEPWNKKNEELQADGEGSLTKRTTEKRSDADFALWKSSKQGEPSWTSPWGKGRPGWHIECSAMASDVIGGTLDIHSGGIDLAFPHHDNELAQAEAYWTASTNGDRTREQWVNYFLHFGHLSIGGAKMSKSLKNFTGIRQALDRGDFTPRGLRILFLLGNWSAGIEITEGLISAGNAWEDKVNNFFLKANMVEERHDGSVATAGVNGISKTCSSDDGLLQALVDAEKQTFEALCDSFDTPSVMRIISDVITIYNSIDKGTITNDTTLVIATWITSMIRVFGLSNTPEGQIGWAGIHIPEAAKPFINPLSKARDEIRRRARSGETDSEAMSALSSEITIAEQNSTEAGLYAELVSNFKQDVGDLAKNENSQPKDYLILCDNLRDVKLWDLGIYLEDQENQPALLRPLDKELITARAEKEDRERQKAATKAEREKKETEQFEKGRTSHLEMFKTEEFSEWDEEGMPTKDAKGEDVAKSKVKKLRKQWDVQRKMHERWSEAQGGAE